VENDSPQRRLSVGEGPEEWLRLELELSVSSMGTREVRGRRCGALTVGANGVGSILVTSCRDGLVVGSSMQGTARGGEAGAAWRLLRWRARRSLTWRTSSSGATAQGERAERDGSGERVVKLGFSSTRKQG
jgi:hypothetical protein